MEQKPLGQISLPLIKLIPWAGAVLVAMIVGTYTLTRAITADQIGALKTQLETARQEVQSTKQTASSALPTRMLEAANQVEPLAELANRISDIEREREVLIRQLVSKSVETLEPSSELASLIGQLKAETLEQRERAITVLFDLANSRALPSLVTYLNTHHEEALSIKALFEWYDLFWELDFNFGVSYALEELESSNLARSDRAFEELYSEFVPAKEEAAAPGIERLKTLAFTSPNAVTRTRAKLLIQAQSNTLDRTEKEVEKNAEHQAELTAIRAKAQAPSTALHIFTVFARADLSHRFSALVGDSDDVTYWKTGLFLLNSLLMDKPNSARYISAAEMIVELDMSTASLGFNLYLLGKMEQFLGNSSRSEHWFRECKKRTPEIYQHLMVSDASFNLETLRDELIKDSG